MQAIAVDTRRGCVTIRSLRNGDVATVRSFFERLGPESRRLRFGSNADALATLARVDGRRHVLVAYRGGETVGIAHLALDDDRQGAEIAIAVADAWQRAGVGSELLRLLTADAAAAGIRHVRAVVRLENRGSLSLARKAARIVARRVEGGEVQLVAATT
jgi:ribosomal protein S18 acetylase RimI-like enzyme